jgi:hypothetical protein
MTTSAYTGAPHRPARRISTTPVDASHQWDVFRSSRDLGVRSPTRSDAVFCRFVRTLCPQTLIGRNGAPRCSATSCAGLVGTAVAVGRFLSLLRCPGTGRAGREPTSPPRPAPRRPSPRPQRTFQTGRMVVRTKSKHRRTWDPRRVAQLRDLAAKGLGQKAIAEALGCSPAAVNAAIMRYRVHHLIRRSRPEEP